MATVKKPEQKPHESVEEQRKCDALALAELLFDIYQEKKRKEKNDEVL